MLYQEVMPTQPQKKPKWASKLTFFHPQLHKLKTYVIVYRKRKYVLPSKFATSMKTAIILTILRKELNLNQADTSERFLFKSSRLR